MPLAGRVGDNAKHGGSDEPAKQGSPDVFINGQAALRVGDEGEGWKASKGSKGVLINGIPAHRVGDETSHNTGSGQLVDGSQDVFVGDLGGGEAKPEAHDRSLLVEVTDAMDRKIHEVVVKVSCPHKDDEEHKITGSTTLTGLCSAATVMIQKALQKGTWDKGASSPEALGPSHAHVDTPPPKAPASPPAPAAAKPAEAAAAKKPAPAKPAAAKPAPAKPAAAKPAAPAPAKPAAPAPASPAAPPAAAKAAPAPAKPAPPAADQQHVVHAPTPPATPPAQNEVHIVRPSTTSAQVRLTTVHNWAEMVFRAFGQTMPTAATEIAILGVREASLSGKGGVDKLEEEAAKGETDKATTTRETRDADFTHATTWNDLLFVVFTDSTPEKAQHVEVFECTIDAGAVESSLGTPITLEGKLYRGQPGSHISKRYPGNDVALHLFTETPGKMELARECTKRYRTFTNIASAKNAATNWRFCTLEDNGSIHMHFGSEGNSVGGWSTGCTVLHHHYWVKNSKGVNVPDPKATRYKRFKDLYTGAANKKKIPYLVVSSQYLRSYAEWARLLDQDPSQAGKPESVILKDKLRAAPGQEGRYLPSFITTQFAQDVIALETAKGTTAAHAANLKSSMERATFTLSI